MNSRYFAKVYNSRKIWRFISVWQEDVSSNYLSRSFSLHFDTRKCEHRYWWHVVSGWLEGMSRIAECQKWGYRLTIYEINETLYQALKCIRKLLLNNKLYEEYKKLNEEYKMENRGEMHESLESFLDACMLLKLMFNS